jgi:hypothetical protein
MRKMNNSIVTIGMLIRVVRVKILNRFLQFLAWGLRELADFKLQSVDSPHLEIEVGGATLVMDKIKSVKKHANFTNPQLFLDVMLPVEELYLPPINIRVLDNRWESKLSMGIGALDKYDQKYLRILKKL